MRRQRLLLPQPVETEAIAADEAAGLTAAEIEADVAETEAATVAVEAAGSTAAETEADEVTIAAQKVIRSQALR